MFFLPMLLIPTFIIATVCISTSIGIANVSRFVRNKFRVKNLQLEISLIDHLKNPELKGVEPIIFFNKLPEMYEK